MLKTLLLTLVALLAFAGNSVLCRLALNQGAIDAASFTAIRLCSGAAVLLLLVLLKNRKSLPQLKQGSWLSGLSLFIYATAFSYAYMSLDTGTGALILFAAVQLTMIITELVGGRRLSIVEWLGFGLAFIGLLVLLLPGAAAPSLTGFGLMALSGMAWAYYTLAGRGSSDALMDTSKNFLRALPFVVVLAIFALADLNFSNYGVLLAIASGAITSGLGYAIWYSALAGLTISQAAVIQLTVPIIAAGGGVLFANELITMNLLIASCLVLGGVLLVILNKQATNQTVGQS